MIGNSDDETREITTMKRATGKRDEVEFGVAGVCSRKYLNLKKRENC